jgi:predicted ester cyclase
MATTAINGLRERREAIVNAHIEAEAVNHDVAATVATFRHPRYEVPALGAIVDGAEAVNGLVTGLIAAFPDFYLHKTALHHADDAVIAEVRFGGTQRGVWAGIEPTGNKMEVQSVLIFVFEGEDLVCEKVYFDHATVLRQLGAIPDLLNANVAAAR